MKNINYGKLDNLESLLKTIAICNNPQKSCSTCPNNAENSKFCYAVRNNKERSIAFYIITNITEYMDLNTFLSISNETYARVMDKQTELRYESVDDLLEELIDFYEDEDEGGVIHE